MAIYVNLTDVKRNLARLINQIRDSHEEILILRHGKSVAKLTGLDEAAPNVQLQESYRKAVSSAAATMEKETLRIQIQNLIARHTQIEDQQLLLALWFNQQNPEGNVYLLEIAEGFPDNGLGRLETFAFAPTPDFQIPGALYLTLTSPTELEDAFRRNDPTLQRILEHPEPEIVYRTPFGNSILEKLKNGA